MRLVTLGGQVDRQVGAALGGGVLAAVEAIRPDLLLLGACGIDAEAGITAHSLDDAAVKRAVAARAGRVAVAADRMQARRRRRPSRSWTSPPATSSASRRATPADLRARLAACGPAIIDVET